MPNVSNRNQNEETTTVVVQIGNSDNRLSQYKWHRFCKDVGSLLNDYASKVHFSGGSHWDAPWQNACWVASVDIEDTKFIQDELRSIRIEYEQESIAFICGDVRFL